MCFSGLIICDARRTFLKSLNDSLKIINKKMSYIALELDGILDKLLSQKPALYVENFFLEKLRENRTKDSISGRTNFSANKTDLLLYDKKKKKTRNFSTGEQKVIVISIILSFLELLKNSKSTELIFLLDDIFSYLDSELYSKIN